MEASPRKLDVDGVVLAAGRSTRMGRPKALLDASGESFIERAVHVLRRGGCRYVLAVVPPDEEWEIRLADVSGAEVIFNPEPASEQIASLRLALAHVTYDAAGAMVLPVDFPLVRASTVVALRESFLARGAPVVRPTYRGRPGHPTLFARTVFPELLDPRLDDGARTLVERHAHDREDVAVDDPGVVTDINTPEDYRRFREER